MGERLRECIRHMVPSAGCARDDAVSPVVGMVLVLGISIVGIAAILYWGLPAIDEMKANVEFQSVQTQFGELDATVKELVAGTTEKTAKRWQPSLNRGQLSVTNNTEAWLFAVDLYHATNTHDFEWTALADGNESFSLTSINGTQQDARVEAFFVHGTSSATALNVTWAGDASKYPKQMQGSDLGPWVAGETHVFRVTQADLPRDIANGTFKFRVWNGSQLAAEAWYASTGRVDYQLDAGMSSRYLIANNGAVLAGMNNGYAIVNSPPLPPPSDTSGTPRIFARFILLGGDAQFTGTDTFDMLVSLYATATLASYDCALADRSDCVGAVKYFNYGTYQAPWYAHLTSRNRGYAYEVQTAVAGDVDYLEDRRPHMGFTLLQSSLKTVSG